MGKKEMLEVLEERRIYLRETFQRVDLAVSESRFLRSLLLSQGFKALRFLQIRQGIKMPVNDYSKNKKPFSPLRLGYIGQIAPHKGIDVLLRALKRYSKLHPGSVLKIYGDLSRVPNYVQRLKRLVEERKTVEFCGSFANERVYEILRDIDVLVVPSLWYENSPNVILEAFASGTPVIASNLGGMTELVENGVNGLLFRRGDDKDLYRQLRKLIDEPELLDSLSRGLRSVKTEDQEMEEIVELSRQLIG
jgi:glycosyltransferase involved in cell wall biosynthesis